jgi:hypothetical protein
MMPRAVFLCAVLSICPSPGFSEAQTPSRAGRIERSFRIDGNEHELHNIQWVAVHRDGTVALAHSGDGLIRYFSIDGRPIARFGRIGDGPGEFRATFVGGWKGDSLWVFDNRRRAVTIVAPDMKTSRRFTLQGVIPTERDATNLPNFARANVLHAGASGLIAEGVGRGPVPPGSSFSTVGRPMFLLAESGEVIRYLGNTADPGVSNIMVLGDNSGVSLTVPFSQEPYHAVSPDGSRIVMVERDPPAAVDGGMRFSAVDAAGARLFSVALPVSSIPVPRDVRDKAIADLQRNPLQNDLLRQAVSQMQVPSNYPAVYDLRVGTDNRIWLRLRGTDAGSPWLVLSPTGIAVGTVVLPRGAIFHHADSTGVLLVELDADEVQSVVRYRVVF